jgi:hypothetical protein
LEPRQTLPRPPGSTRAKPSRALNTLSASRLPLTLRKAIEKLDFLTFRPPMHAPGAREVPARLASRAGAWHSPPSLSSLRKFQWSGTGRNVPFWNAGVACRSANDLSVFFANRCSSRCQTTPGLTATRRDPCGDTRRGAGAETPDGAGSAARLRAVGSASTPAAVPTEAGAKAGVLAPAAGVSTVGGGEAGVSATGGGELGVLTVGSGEFGLSIAAVAGDEAEGVAGCGSLGTIKTKAAMSTTPQ